MAENFLFSVNTVLPLLLLMSVGFLCRRLHMMDDTFIRQGNNLVFRVFLPILLCKNIMDAGTADGSTGNVFLYVSITVAALFLLLFLVIPLIEKDNRKRGVLIQGIGRSNYALFGIPLVSLLFPNEDVSIASLLVLITVPLFNILSTIALEVFNENNRISGTTAADSINQPVSGKGGSVSGKHSQVLHIVRGILLNPLIIGSAIGFLLLKLNFTFPSVIGSVVSQLSRVATPLALFLLGGSFEFSKVSGNVRQLVIGVFGKLVFSPLIFVTLAALLGFRGPALAAILITFASPSAASSYTMAQQMGGDSELAAEQIVFSSLFSIATVFLFILVLKTLNLI